MCALSVASCSSLMVALQPVEALALSTDGTLLRLGCSGCVRGTHHSLSSLVRERAVCVPDCSCACLTSFVATMTGAEAKLCSSPRTFCSQLPSGLTVAVCFLAPVVTMFATERAMEVERALEAERARGRPPPLLCCSSSSSSTRSTICSIFFSSCFCSCSRLASSELSMSTAMLAVMPDCA